MREIFMYFGIISIRHLSIHSIYFKIFVITTIRHYSRLEFRAILFFAIILLRHRWAIQFRKCLISLIARNWMARIVSYHHDSENWCLIKWYPLYWNWVLFSRFECFANSRKIRIYPPTINELIQKYAKKKWKKSFSRKLSFLSGLFERLVRHLSGPVQISGRIIFWSGPVEENSGPHQDSPLSWSKISG